MRLIRKFSLIPFAQKSTIATNYSQVRNWGGSDHVFFSSSDGKGGVGVARCAIHSTMVQNNQESRHKAVLNFDAQRKMANNESSHLFPILTVVYHHGKSATGGHYTTDSYHIGVNGWIHMDDATVRKLPQGRDEAFKHVPNRVPYLLYYRRCDLLQ